MKQIYGDRVLLVPYVMPGFILAKQIYEKTKDNDPKKNHTKEIAKWLNELDARVDVRDAVARHGWSYVEGAPEPETKMDWALYCCDELTGFIVAVALVKPDKRLSSVTVDSVLKKWNSSSFAAGVHRVLDGAVSGLERSTKAAA